MNTQSLILIIGAWLLSLSPLNASLSLEDQIGQLLIAYVDGDHANEGTYALLKEHRLGGVILYNWCNKLDSPEQVSQLSQGLQEQAERLGLPPLFIATDQEGGLVARLRHGFTEFPGNAALGRSQSEELAFLAARDMGLEARQVGINLVFAPVVDVNSNPRNPIIGIRSFGDHPDLVARMGLAATAGFKEAGIMSCLKHFPGHGDVEVDSHESLPHLSKSRADLDALELLPFKAILNESPAIMTAHLRVPSLDPQHCATLSKTIVTQLLREELGYEGLIITDSLTMGAIEQSCGHIGQAALQALQAGCDLLVIGEHQLNQEDGSFHNQELRRIKSTLLEAVAKGQLSADRIGQSVERVLRFKKRFENRAPLISPRQAHEHAYAIAAHAIQLERGVYPADLYQQRITLIAPQLLTGPIAASGLTQLGHSCQLFCFQGLEPSAEECEQLEAVLKESDAILFLSYNAWRFPGQKALLLKLSERYPLTLIATRDAQDALLSPHAQNVITTVSPTAVSLRAVHDCLCASSYVAKGNAFNAR